VSILALCAGACTHPAHPTWSSGRQFVI
jgi:hypothetical protein